LTIDWVRFRNDVLAKAWAAQTIPDTYPAIREALRLLGDGHSSYRPVTGAVIFVPTRTCQGSGASVPTVPATIGYVKVGAFSGSGAAATAFATAIQGTIRTSDRPNLAGWIVDVRGNGGGNMWPMVAGVGPIIGEGVLGYFINPVGFESVWEYRDGASWSSGVVLQRVDAPYTLIRQRPKVAVLVDNGIASSGEAVVIAFKQRPDTRFFGVATCGLSTSNSGFTLSDGAQLILTTAVMADRTKARYGDAVQPDEGVVDTTQMVQRAIDWIQGSGS
jgi:carboxyl-terminal processing protease